MAAPHSLGGRCHVPPIPVGRASASEQRHRDCLKDLAEARGGEKKSQRKLPLFLWKNVSFFLETKTEMEVK